MARLISVVFVVVALLFGIQVSSENLFSKVVGGDAAAAYPCNDHLVAFPCTGGTRCSNNEYETGFTINCDVLDAVPFIDFGGNCNQYLDSSGNPCDAKISYRNGISDCLPSDCEVF